MGFESPLVSIQSDEIGVVYMIETKDSPLLIGNRGETLHALNNIIKRIAEKEGVEDSFSIDVNNYQKIRNDDIKAKARMLAERAKQFEVDVDMDPMSSYERMIVHAALAEDGKIKTESTGFGRDRKVVIKYVKDEDFAA